MYCNATRQSAVLNGFLQRDMDSSCLEQRKPTELVGQNDWPAGDGWQAHQGQHGQPEEQAPNDIIPLFENDNLFS